MDHFSFRLIALVGVAIGASRSIAVAQQEQAEAKGEPLSALRSVYLKEASAYRFFLDAGKSEELALEPKPAMSWTGTDGWSGDIFIWTRGGRPQVIGGVGSWPTAGKRNVFHEFQSLAEGPLQEVQVGDAITWSPSAGGVEFREVEGAQPPADAERFRLVQMRQLAKQFEPHMLDQSGDETLRLLPQPLYRYKHPSGDVVDGALFGFVFSTTGTDLDFLLMLECRKTPAGAKWHYAPARLTRRELWLLHGGKEVWRVEWHEPAPRDGVIDQTYVTTTVKTIDDPPVADAPGK